MTQVDSIDASLNEHPTVPALTQTWIFRCISLICPSLFPRQRFLFQPRTNLEGTNVESRVSLRDRGKVDRAENQLTVMLLCVTFVFVLLTMPQYTRYIVYTFLPMDGDSATFATFVLIYHITNKAFYTNSAVNFWLYVASGSKFRHDLKRLCCKRRHKFGRASTLVSSSRTRSTDLALASLRRETSPPVQDEASEERPEENTRILLSDA